MGEHVPRGVVLKTAPLRESDLLVTLFTDQHGRISALARGARRSKIRFAGTLSLLVLGRYQLGRAPRGDIWNLESGEIEREWTHLSSDVIAVAHASYIAELVASLLPAEVPEPEVLDVMTGLWDCLAAHGPSPAALRAVELALLELTGQMPAIDRCAACSNLAADGAVFDASRGGVLCASCASRSRAEGVRMFHASARAYLRAIRNAGGPSSAQALDTDPRFTFEDKLLARDALVSMLLGIIGKPLRSLEYIAKLGAAGRRQDPGA